MCGPSSGNSRSRTATYMITGTSFNYHCAGIVSYAPGTPPSAPRTIHSPTPLSWSTSQRRPLLLLLLHSSRRAPRSRQSSHPHTRRLNQKHPVRPPSACSPTISHPRTRATRMRSRPPRLPTGGPIIAQRTNLQRAPSNAPDGARSRSRKGLQVPQAFEL